MMKKLFAVLFSILCILPCMANIHIRSEAVETVIKQKITDTDAQIAALAEYIAQIKNAGTNAGIPASGVWSVCVAAGWDIKTQDGKSKCVDFGNALIKYANWNFRAVCGADKFMVERGTGYCIDNVFSNQVIGGTKVNRLTANGLVHEYARVKFDDNNLVCSKGLRKTTLPPDDYIQCISMDKNIAYEFAFDSVTATNDSIIASGLEEAVCKIFDSKYSPSGVTLDTAYSKGQTWPAACETTDSTICSKINETMSRFGRSAKIGTTGTNANKHTACIIDENTFTSVDQLRTAFGIDNQVFKNAGIQLNANVSLKEQVCDYVRKNVTNPEIINCTCNDAPTAVYDWSGIVTEKDDVLTCTINGKPVDFLFDDLSESNKRIASGGTQGMSCIVSGGTYSGERCIGLGEQQCNVLRQSNLTDCPECKAAKWDEDTKSCILPSSKSAQNLQKGINIGLIVGGAVVGVALTVVAVGATTAVAGATAASVAATKTAIVLTAIETVGAGIELNAQLKINGIADDFLVKSNKCQSASCAKEMLSLNLQRMANYANDMTAAEVDAVDRELAKLTNLIPDDDELWATMLVNGTDMADNQLGFWNSWEPEQVWRAVGIGLQLTSLITGITKWAISKSNHIAKSTAAIKQKFARAIQHIKKTPTSKKVVVGLIDERKFVAQIDIEDYIQTLRQQGYDIEVIETYTSLDTKKFGQNILENKNLKAAEAASQSEFRIFRISTYTESTDMAQIDMDFINHASDIDKNYRQGFVAQKYRKIAVEDEDSWYNTYKTILEEYSSKDADILYAKEHWKDMDIEAKKHFIEETNQKFRNLICEDPKSCTINWGAAEELGGEASYDPQRLGSSALSESDIQSDTYAYSIPHRRSTFEDTLLNIIHENLHYGQDIGKTDMPKYLLDHNTDNYILPRDIPGIETYGFSKPAYTLQPLEIETKGADHKILQGVLEHMEK